MSTLQEVSDKPQEQKKPLGAGVVAQANSELNRIEALTRTVKNPPRWYDEADRRIDCDEIIRRVRALRTDLRGLGRCLEPR